MTSMGSISSLCVFMADFVHLLDEVCRHAVSLEVGEDGCAHGRVGPALVFPRAAFLRVECSRVVLVAVDEHAVFVRRENLLRLSFVEQFFRHFPASPFSSSTLSKMTPTLRSAYEFEGLRDRRPAARAPLLLRATPGSPLPGLHRRTLDDRVSVVAAHALLDEREQDGPSTPRRQVEVLEHPVLVDL